MERGVKTRAQSKKSLLLPPPTKMAAKKEELTRRPVLATLDNNSCRLPQQQGLAKKPIAKVLPVHKENQLHSNQQDTTTSRARRPPPAAGKQGRKITAQETTKLTATNKIATETAFSPTNVPRHASLPQAPSTAHQDHFIASITLPRKRQPLKDCHSLLPDYITTSDTLPHYVTEKDLADPYQCVEYLQDIYQHLLMTENKEVFKIRPDLMCRQTHVDVNHRRVLVDWLVQVHQRFSLLPDTLHISMDILDRYLQVRMSHCLVVFCFIVYSF